MTVIVIDRTLGTNIGDMTSNGGLAAAFDGVTSQATTACARKTSAGYIGKTLDRARRFGGATIYGSNDAGFEVGGSGSQTINIRGKNGAAPSSRTDGTVIGTVTFSDTADESAGRNITSTDTATRYDHIFAEIINGNPACAELVLREFIPDNMVALLI